MERIKLLNRKISSNVFFLAILFLVFCGVLIANFPPANHFITGWDNLHPEFNFPLNLKRIFEGVWQANEGLGVIGGHGYAASAPHTIFLWLLSFVVPLSKLRAFFTFLMLLVGSVGAYYMTKYLLKNEEKERPILTNFAALIAGLFYMLNIGTVQNFYIQLEAFIVHFAFLPWFILALWNYLEKGNRKSLVLFILVNILILPAQFIPPLFIVQGIITFIILMTYLLKTRNLRTVIWASVIIFLVNAYWFLPFVYYTLTHSANYLNAYNNIQSTSDFIEKNLKYGNLQNVALIKSFLFESFDIDASGKLFPILTPWIKHFDSLQVRSIAYGLFGLSILGLISSFITFWKRQTLASASLIVSFIIIFTLFATDTPPFSIITQLLRHISLFEQAFRITFTKFSIAYVMLISVFLGLGVHFILERVRFRFVSLILGALIVLSLLYYAKPAFTGNFIYQPTKIAIPSDYFNFFDYMKTQPADGRIMNLAQGWNWGWTLYTWGYTGSGFLWYGTEQPIMDRAFDVWSPYNENYYWELSRALFSKDYNQLDSLLEKYQISYVLYDPSVVSYPGERQALYSRTTRDYLASSSKFSLLKVFGNLELYRVNLVNKQTNDILEYKSLPNVLPTYNWNNNDTAFERAGTYMSDATLKPDVYYPFRSLFSNRNVIEREVSIGKYSGGYIITSRSASNTNNNFITQNYSDPTVPAELKIEKANESVLKISVKFLYPASTFTQNTAEGKSWSVNYPTDDKTLSLSVNTDVFKLNIPASGAVFDRNLLLSVKDVNPILIQDEVGESVLNDEIEVPAPATSIENAVSQASLKVPYVDGQSSYFSQEDPAFLLHKETDCTTVEGNLQKTITEGGVKSLVFSNNNEQKSCLDIYLPNTPQDTGYLLEIQSKHVLGSVLQFALVNQQAKKTDFQVSLPPNSDYQTSYIFIPSMQADGVGYSLHFENDSTTKEAAINYLRLVRLTPVPYFYLTNLRIGDTQPPTPLNVPASSVKQIFPTLYKVTPAKGAKVIVFSQAYDNDWIMSGGAKHVIVNNWENGWVIDGKEKVYYIFFWPELLEYIGFGLMVGAFLLLFKK